MMFLPGLSLIVHLIIITIGFINSGLKSIQKKLIKYSHE